MWKKIKNKRNIAISALSTFFIGLTTSTFVIGLSSCVTASDIFYPSANVSSFSSLNSSVLPVSAAALSTETGRGSLVNTYINKLLNDWYQIVNNNSIEIKVKDWVKEANDSYKSEYDYARKNNGSNWAALFQKNILDPIGGTKNDFLLNKMSSNFKSTLVDALFGSSAKNYLAYSSNPNSTNPTFQSTNDLDLNILNRIDNTYVNASKIGEKNGFRFTSDALKENERINLDIGYADLMEFIMDSWIHNKLPLPLSMSLWKNNTDQYELTQLFSPYFDRFDNSSSGDNSGSDSGDSSNQSRNIRADSTTSNSFAPSYNFQYFSDSSTNPTKLTSTDKFKALIENLYKGQYVNKTTGLIKLDNTYTEDSSTILLSSAESLFDGTYVTPFSAAAWYKFSNYVFGITDPNIHVASQIDSKSIMNNFLVYNTADNTVNNTKNLNVETNGQASTIKGVFKFPYPVTWTNGNSQTIQSIFTNEYSNAIGIIDIINLSNTTNLFDNTGSNGSQTPTSSNNNLGDFILVRNQFGVHIIGIDRISKLKEAYNSSSNSTFSTKFKSVCNELRNTFIYYLALDYANKNTGASTTYNVIDSLKSYFENNFETLIFNYVKQYIDNPSQNKNNLFGSYVTQAKSNNSIIDFNNNYGFDLVGTKNDELTKSYIDSLNEIKLNQGIRNLIDASLDYSLAVSAKEFNDSINSKIYENQSKYNDNIDSKLWVKNGIAGVLSFTRNNTTGRFDSLTKLVNAIVSNKLDNTATIDINANSSRQLSAPIPSITVTDTKTNLIAKKNNYQTNVINYLNNSNLTVINSTSNDFVSTPTYIFTSNDYVNKALLAIGSNSLSSIVKNMYIQSYLYPSRKFNINLGNVTVEGSNGWIANKIIESINSTYKINNFVKSNNFYAYGDWSTYDQFKTISNNYFDDSMNENQFSYQFSDSNDVIQFYSYGSYESISSYYDLLTTLRYVLNYNTEKQIFDFGPLVNLLTKATEITDLSVSRNAVAWINQDSMTMKPDFGYSYSDSENVLSVTDVQKKMQSNTQFKKMPLLLTNTNSYSWFNSLNPYDSSNSNDLSYTKNSSYWVASPLSPTSNSTNNINTGFLGFQLSSQGSSEMSGAWLNNATYSNAPINQINIQYRGMLYHFGNRSNLVKLVNDVNNVFWLREFYSNNLEKSGLPIKDSSIANIKQINETVGPNYLYSLKTEILSILNDNTQVPDTAFERLEQMPLWTKNGSTSSTLFNSSSDAEALKNQYIVTQFNSDDVAKLMSSTGGLNTGFGKYLGLNADTFFNAVVMLCSSSSTLKNEAIQNMYSTVGQISIYDIRLLNVIERNWISNYDDWTKIQNLK